MELPFSARRSGRISYSADVTSPVLCRTMPRTTDAQRDTGPLNAWPPHQSHEIDAIRRIQKRIRIGTAAFLSALGLFCATMFALEMAEPGPWRFGLLFLLLTIMASTEAYFAIRAIGDPTGKRPGWLHLVSRISGVGAMAVVAWVLSSIR